MLIYSPTPTPSHTMLTSHRFPCTLYFIASLPLLIFIAYRHYCPAHSISPLPCPCCPSSPLLIFIVTTVHHCHYWSSLSLLSIIVTGVLHAQLDRFIALAVLHTQFHLLLSFIIIVTLGVVGVVAVLRRGGLGSTRHPLSQGEIDDLMD